MARELQGHVRVREDVLEVHFDPAPLGLIDFAVLAGLGVMLFGLIGISSLFLPGDAVYVLAALILGGLGLGGVGLVLLTHYLHGTTGLRVVSSAYRGGDGAWRQPNELVLQGRPGDRIVLTSDAGLLFSQDPSAEGVWRPAQLFWLAQRIAAQLGLPLRESLDRRAWQRWEHDPAFRSETRYRTRIRKSQRTFASFYQTHPLEPADAKHEPEGLVLDGLMLEPRGIRTAQVGLGWAEIHAVEVEFRNRQEGVEMVKYAKLLIWTRRGLLGALDRRATHRNVAELLWVRDRMRANLGRREDTGSLADVPQELLAARRQRD